MLYHNRLEEPGNYFDRLIWKKIQSSPNYPQRRRRFTFYIQVLETMVLGLSDTQLVTALAILIIGFAGLDNAGISVYHFTVITDLAWMSSNSHLLTLILLRKYLREQDLDERERFFVRTTPTCLSPSEEFRCRRHRKNMEKVVKLWRLVGMFLIFCCLFAAGLVEGHQHWADHFQCPAKCVIQDLPGNIGGRPQKWMITSLTLLQTAYLTSIVPVFTGSMQLWKSFRDRIMQLLPKRNRFVRILRFALWSYSCALSQILGQMAWFCIGTWCIVSDVARGQSLLKENTEIELGFGQIVPLILLMLPVMAAIETWYGE